MGGYYFNAGARFGRWTALEDCNWKTKRVDGRQIFNRIRCRCNCGREYLVIVNSLIYGKSTNCNHCKNRTHGFSDHPLYNTWKGIIDRCTNPHNAKYEDYGGRGIYVEPEWLGSEGLQKFINDIEVVLGPKQEGESLDRIDNDGPYILSNIQWSWPDEQINNRRPNISNAQYSVILEEKRALQAENDQLRKRIAELTGLISYKSIS